MNGRRVSRIGALPSALYIERLRRQPAWRCGFELGNIEACSLEQFLPLRFVFRSGSFVLTRDSVKIAQPSKRIQTNNRHAGYQRRWIEPLHPCSSVIRHHRLRTLPVHKTYCARIRASNRLAMRRSHLVCIAIQQIGVIPVEPPGAICNLAITKACCELRCAIFEHFGALADWIQPEVRGIVRDPKNGKKHYQDAGKKRPCQMWTQRLLTSSSGDHLR